MITFLTKIQNFPRYLWAHKVIGLMLLAALSGATYYAYTAYASTDGEVRYVLGRVETKDIVSTISASGQVASSDETDIKAKASGDIISISVKEGARVSQGQIIASIESVSARSAVTDALLALEEAELNLEEATLKSPIDFKGLQADVDRAKRDVADTYDDAYVALSEAFVKLPDVITGADSLLYDADITTGTDNVNAYVNMFISASNNDQSLVKGFADRAEDDYEAARASYTKTSATFKSLSRTSNARDIEDALREAKTMSALLGKAVASEGNLIDTVIDILDRRDWNIPSAVPLAQTDARTYISTTNSVLSSLTSAEKAIDTAKDSLTDAEEALALAAVGNPDGTSSFDLKLLENTVKQKRASLADAREVLADHSVRAPFAGVLASLTAKRGDSVTNGGSIGTLITDQKIAELSLNEVDVAKIMIGDKATLTFDAIEGLTMTGSVAEIDSIGTVVQGVVSYTVKIGLDDQDESIKSGMTVNAVIETESVKDARTVPSSAVKTERGKSYVLIFNPEINVARTPEGILSSTPPTQAFVEVGISDDSSVQIISGLTEGQQIVTRTITGATATNTATSNRGGLPRPPGF